MGDAAYNKLYRVKATTVTICVGILNVGAEADQRNCSSLSVKPAEERTNQKSMVRLPHRGLRACSESPPSSLRQRSTVCTWGLLLVSFVLVNAEVPAQPLIDQPPPRQVLTAVQLAAQGLAAPIVTNTGHDFAALNWTAFPGVPVGHRVWSSRWGPSFIARHAPDWSGVYVIDGETFEVCTRRDGLLGEGRMAVFLKSDDGGFSAFGAGKWDVVQGGYSGVLLHSNNTDISGPLLVYKHKDGWLRLREGRFDLDPSDYPQTAARVAELRQHAFPSLACELFPPPPSRFQHGVPYEATGRYVSNYNESIAACSSNGSLVVAFSGLGYQQGFASGVWVAERQQYEGLMVEIGATRPFVWKIDAYGTITGTWDAYNRTFEEFARLPENATRGYAWEARRDWAALQPLPSALSAAGLGVDHLCSLLIASDSGMRPSRGDVGDAEDQSDAAAAAAAQGRSPGPGDGWHAPALARGYGAGIFEIPSFTQKCHNTTDNQTRPDGSFFLNVTEVCIEAKGEYDESGFYRRAPAQQRYAWLRDQLAFEDSGNGTFAVVAPLQVEEEYIFRVAPLYAAGGGSTFATGAPGTGSAGIATNAVIAANAGSMAGKQLSVGSYSAYSLRTRIELSGPGAPVELEVDDVTATSLRLSWRAPPFDHTTGIWHGDGGAPLLGYRILLRDGNQDFDQAVIVASTTETEYTLTKLRPQTLIRLTVVAENMFHRGLYSATLSVATAALRATLWSECSFASHVHQPMAYQGCFRDVDRPPHASDMSLAASLHRPDVPLTESFSWQLTAELCAHACEPSLYFGMRSGGYCLCGETFGRYGAVEDTECTTPCSGHSARMCGGRNRTSVYRRAGPHGVLLGVGSYHSYDLIRMMLAKRSLSSVQVPSGLVLTLYTRDGLQGTSVNLTGEVACLSSTTCSFDSDTVSWAEPALRCDGDVWNDQAESLRLDYTSGLLPAYRPRPGAETGARAFARGTAGMLARLDDLGGDIRTATNTDRPAGGLSQFWRAPRMGDDDDCAERVGSYSADNVCLQSARMHVPDVQETRARANPYRLLDMIQTSKLEAEFSDEFARLKRIEWRDLLRAYALPLFEQHLQRSGDGVASASLQPNKAHSAGGFVKETFAQWFDAWFASIKHLVHLLGSGGDGAPPTLGFSASGEVVPWVDSVMPPLPAHPFPRAEERGDGISAPAADGTREAVLAHLQAADMARQQRGESTGETRKGPQHTKMTPYTAPKMEQRAAHGGENQAYSAAMGAIYSVGFAGSDRPPQVGTAAYAAMEPISPTLMQDRQRAAIEAKEEQEVEEAFFSAMR